MASMTALSFLLVCSLSLSARASAAKCRTTRSKLGI